MILFPFIMPIAHGIVLHSCVCIFFGLYVCTHPCISWLACSCISYIHSHIGLVLLLFHPFVICDKNWDIFRQLLSFILLRELHIIRGRCIYKVEKMSRHLFIFRIYLLVWCFGLSFSIYVFYVSFAIVFVFFWIYFLSIVDILNCLHIWMIITYCFDQCSHILYGCWLFGQVIFMHIFSYILDCIVLVSSFLLLYLL